MWTKIQSQADVNKLKLNSRLLKFTGDGTPKDPPPHDPSYTLFVLHQNTVATSSLSKTGQNPLFTASFGQASPVPLPVPAEEMIEEGIWWF
jgi:hypothetical protein